MRPEVYFIKYAFPCSKILLKVRGDITQEEYDKMKDAAINNKALNRKFLEKVFWRAFERLTKIATELRKDKWDLEVIKEYFVIRHNGVLENSDYPESFKEQCKVFNAEIEKEEKNEEVIAKYKDDQGKQKRRRIKKEYLPELKVGDKVRIHWDYAVEKI